MSSDTLKNSYIFGGGRDGKMKEFCNFAEINIFHKPNPMTHSRSESHILFL